MAVNLASKFSKKVAERFYTDSFTEIGVNRDYDWEGVDTVSIYSIDTVPMNNYVRNGANRYGNPAELQDTVDTHIVTRDRSFSFTIDRGNKIQQMGVKMAGKALSRQLREQLIPEVDTYRLATMAAAAVANGSTTGAPVPVDATNAYSKFLDAQAILNDKQVPMGGRVAFINSEYAKFLKLDSNFSRQTADGSKMAHKGVIGEVDGVTVVQAPSLYFPADTPLILTHPVATVAPDQLKDYKTHDNPPGTNGYLVEGRHIYDAFVLEAKQDAIVVHQNA